MNLHMDLQIFLDWIRRHLSPGFNERAKDVYTDEYEIAYDRLLTLGRDMRNAVHLNDVEYYLKFKELYIETFSLVSMEGLRDEMDEITDEIVETSEYNGNPISRSMAEQMSIDQISSISFAHNYWAEHLEENQSPSNCYIPGMHPKKELQEIRNTFLDQRSLNEPEQSHTLNCYNSLFDNDEFISIVTPINRARKERLKKIKRNYSKSSFMSASNPLGGSNSRRSKSVF